MYSQKIHVAGSRTRGSSEGRFGRVEGGRPFFWVGNSPSKNVEVTPSMAWAEDAWQGEGLRGEEAQHLQRLESGEWGTRQGCGGQPVTPSRQPCAVPTQGGAGVIIPDSPSGCVVSNTGGRSPLLLPAGISHCSTRSAQMHCWLQELLMQDRKISVWACSPPSGRALMPVT